MKSLYTITTFARINTRRFFRDKLSIFFGIMFPLIFLFVFGGIFGSDSNSAEFRIAVLNKSDSSFAKDFEKKLIDEKTFEVDQTVVTRQIAEEKMSRSQLDATIILPTNFGMAGENKQPTGQAEVLYTQNNEQAGQTLNTILSGIFKDINQQITQSNEPFSVKGTRLQNESLSQFDYIFAGLLGFSLLGVGIFGPVNIFPELKKQGILRRLSTTPLRVWQYFSSMVISQSIIGLVSITVMFIVAFTLFELRIAGNIFELIGFLVFSIVLILGIGLAIGGWAKNERQAAPLSNIVVFPMLFLSGTFFPRFLMPEWLQTVSNFLPLTPVIDGIRLIVTEGAHYVDLLPQLGTMLAWTVVIYFVAFRVFRWE